MPESLTRQLCECTEREGATLDQLLSPAAAEKLSTLMTVDHRRERAYDANSKEFEDFLSTRRRTKPG